MASSARSARSDVLTGVRISPGCWQEAAAWERPHPPDAGSSQYSDPHPVLPLRGQVQSSTATMVRDPSPSPAS
eukprot:4224538-Prymnesium_polylepis.1